MAEEPAASNTFQWRWVGITFGLYVVLYLLPILLVGNTSPGATMSAGSKLFVGIWSFLGIIILSGISGYLSEGVTIWEPAIAGLFAVLLWFIILLVSFSQRGSQMSFEFVPYLIGMMLVIFLLSLFGAIAGERLQEFRNKKRQA